MVIFYILAGLLAVATALILAWPLVRGRAPADSRAAQEVQLYRDQLAEIERDLARGVIDPDEAEGARAEVSRRLLKAAEQAEREAAAARAPRRLTRLVSAAAGIALPVAAAAFYFVNGAPGMPDRPLAARSPSDLVGLGAFSAFRLSQREAESEFGPGEPPEVPDALKQYAELLGRVEKIVEQRPDDVRGLELLAEGYMRLGRYSEAWPVWRRLILAKGDEAEAEDYASLAEAMIFAAGGYVSREAEQVLAEAIDRDPSLPQARYYAAMSIAQDGRREEAVAMWEKLRAEAPEDAPWLVMVEEALAAMKRQQDLAAMGGMAMGAPASGGASGGPTAADVAAARDMSPEERQAMIEGMVSRLEARLTSTGGPPEEWLRLVNAYLQLGRRDDAVRVVRLALAAYEGQGEAAFIREQALLMGLIEE